jgi:hypothetical protein
MKESLGLIAQEGDDICSNFHQGFAGGICFGLGDRLKQVE